MTRFELFTETKHICFKLMDTQGAFDYEELHESAMEDLNDAILRLQHVVEQMDAMSFRGTGSVGNAFSRLLCALGIWK